MSRSRRKTPIIGFTSAESDAPGKIADTRRVRRRNKMRVQAGKDPIDARAIGGPWHWPKDGKYWDASLPDKYWRK
jgi:hypothetical protein